MSGAETEETAGKKDEYTTARNEMKVRLERSFEMFNYIYLP
jgi:hypothetical protein